MKTLTTEQIEELKTMDWQDDRGGDLLYFTNTNDNYFQDITGVCVSCLRELLGNDNTINSFYWEIAYRFHKGDTFNYYDLHYAIWCRGDVVKDGVIQEFGTDVLGLFTEEREEQTTDEDPIELLKKALKLCAEKEVATPDITSVIEDYDYLYDAIKENIIDNLGVEDLSDSLMEDAANEYIEQNPADCYERAMNNMDSYEVKDKIIDYLSDNL